jgi:predicted small integral membrane protein
MLGLGDWFNPHSNAADFCPSLPTTRGDRFFIGLLGSAYIHLAWLGLTDCVCGYATAISVVWMIVVMRWG